MVQINYMENWDVSVHWAADAPLLKDKTTVNRDSGSIKLVAFKPDPILRYFKERWPIVGLTFYLRSLVNYRYPGVFIGENDVIGYISYSRTNPGEYHSTPLAGIMLGTPEELHLGFFLPPFYRAVRESVIDILNESIVYERPYVRLATDPIKGITLVGPDNLG
jgi:hypothetical protein